jgi:pimeloyl-ACP methyl ester carboxylesterase
MAMMRELHRKERILEADGLRIGYFEAGNGDPVIVFPAKAGDFAGPLLARIAESYRVISLNVSDHDFATANRLAEELPGALHGLRIERCSLIGISAGADPALALAIAAPELIDRLILLSPLQPSEATGSRDPAGIKTATLVLVGTRDNSGAIEMGRRCREKIPSCHLSFVYGAGHELTSDRAEACLDPILQFLDEGEQFIIFRESQLIRP